MLQDWLGWLPSTWDELGAAGTTLGTLVALVGLAWSFHRAQRSDALVVRGQAIEQEVAQKSAERAEAAAALTEQYTQRIVDALESMAQNQAATISGVAAVEASRVRWSMAHLQGDAYLLTNIGTATAEQVNLSKHHSLPFFEVESDVTLQPDEALQFMAVRVLGTSDSTITVTWSQKGDEPGQEPHTWKYPLPPRRPGSEP